MKVMVLGKLALVMVVGVGLVSGQRPSSAEFNLFCRIMRRADDLMYGPGYVYDEDVDREIIEEMTVLYNATTDDMKDFGNSLWDRKEFLKEHPPPTDPKNREEAHREIGNLIDKGEKKIEENKKVAEKVNEKIKEAKLSVARGFYGEHVKEVPKDEKNLTEILSDTGSVFVSNTSAKESCGNESKETGKTLLNDFFCLCVGEYAENNVAPPCNGYILSPKKNCDKCCTACKDCCKTGTCCASSCTGNCKCCGCWTQMKYASSGSCPLSLADSIKKIEHVCNQELVGGLEQIKDMNGLLTEYLGMIEMGNKKTDKTKKKIFGHSERSTGGETNKVKECDGSGNEGSSGTDNEAKNEKICVDYTKHFSNGKTYNIPWHNKFKNYTDLMKQAKDLEDQILKNRAALLLLKSKAWIAYNRESDDETSNLDDMNMSHLFDGDKIPFSLPFAFIFLFMIL